MVKQLQSENWQLYDGSQTSEKKWSEVNETIVYHRITHDVVFGLKVYRRKCRFGRS